MKTIERNLEEVNLLSKILKEVSFTSYHLTETSLIFHFKIQDYLENKNNFISFTLKEEHSPIKFEIEKAPKFLSGISGNLEHLLHNPILNFRYYINRDNSLKNGYFNWCFIQFETKKGRVTLRWVDYDIQRNPILMKVSYNTYGSSYQKEFLLPEV